MLRRVEGVKRGWKELGLGQERRGLWVVRGDWRGSENWGGGGGLENASP
jgi:hypothetical protein